MPMRFAEKGMSVSGESVRACLGGAGAGAGGSPSRKAVETDLVTQAFDVEFCQLLAVGQVSDPCGG